MLIAIEGIIGAGKTTLAKRLAEEWNTNLLLERFEDNPYLTSFYKDPKHFALPLGTEFCGTEKPAMGESLSFLGPREAFNM